MTRLSVLLPVRNGAPFITRAVDSTLASLDSDDELCVLDDASEDNTKSLLRRFKDKRLRIITADGRLGISRGLNLLLSQANGTFVARMDADDICLPWRFKLQFRQIQKSDFVFGTAIFFGPHRLPRPEQPGSISAAALPFHLLTGNMLVHPTMFSRKETLDELGGYKDVAAEDYDLWLRAIVAGKTIVRHAVPVILYRKHLGQTSQGATWAEWNEDTKRNLDIDTVFAEVWLKVLKSSSLSPPSSRAPLTSGDKDNSLSHLYAHASAELDMAQARLLRRRLRGLKALH